MKMIRKTLPIILIFVLCGLVFGQNDKTTPQGNSGLIIGRAKSLPKPAAWQTCDCKYEKPEEVINVQIEIDENGNVTSATTISGHPVLRAVSEASARNSKFTPAFFNGKLQKTYSELTYIFNIGEGEVSVRESQVKFVNIPLGNLNEKAILLPMPRRPFGNYKVAEDSSVGVVIKIDLRTGNVVEAKGAYGHPLFRKIVEDVALQAKFDFTKSNIPAKFGTGVLWYKVNDFTRASEDLVIQKQPSKIQPVKKPTKVKAESIDTSPIVSLCVVNGKAINLEKPEYPKAAKAVKAAGEVNVQVIIDKKGNVIEAKAVSGHPLLRANAVKAALKSTFEPVKLSGKPVKVSSVIVYKFLL